MGDIRFDETLIIFEVVVVPVVLLVGGFVLVRKLEDLVVSVRDGGGSREGIVVDLLLEVLVGLVAEAVEE